MVFNNKEELAQAEREHKMRLLADYKRGPGINTDGKNKKLKDFVEPEDLVVTTVRIRKRHAEWLKDNEGVNLSGILRERLDELIKGN